MARRTSGSNYSTVQICAFWGLVLAGVAGLIHFFIVLMTKIFDYKWPWAAKVGGACSFISQIALFVSAWLAAWDFVKGKSKAWRVVFWIFFILALLGLVGLGINSWLK